MGAEGTHPSLLLEELVNDRAGSGLGSLSHVLAYSHDRDEVFLVEVKSHLREEGLQQMLRILREFHEFFPGHEGKKVYGILAVVDVPDEVRDRVLREGIYLARIHDNLFEIQTPEGFQPRAF